MPSIIPEPAMMTMREGAFTVTSGTALVCPKNDESCLWVARYVADLVKRSRGLTLEPRSGGDTKGAITFETAPGGGPESYRLDVTPDGIAISAPTRAGQFYGAITLWQLLTQDGGETSQINLPAVLIEDRPRFAWRGLLLDSVRHFQSVAFVKSFIDAMAIHKLNVLQWHLTDDQGWRIEIKRYPKLTGVGAWRVPAGHAPAHDIDPATGKPRLYGGYYTQDEIRDVVAYAARRNVTIVPEIEMPGHAMAAIVAYPELGSVKNPPKAVSSDWGVFPYLYNADDKTFDFLENVLTEVMGLFPSKYIHIGGDEAVKDQWKASPEIQARMKQLGIKSEDALQGYFTARIGKFLEAHGRRLIGWDEILDGGVPPDATITSWRGIEGAINSAKTGHDAVLSPAPTLYLDNRQAEGADEPPGRGAIVTLKDVYDFDPAPAALTVAQQSHIIGLQANIWTEHIREEKFVDYAAFPRAAALAERAWSPAGANNWSGFLGRMQAELGRYRMLGFDHSLSAFAARIDAAPTAGRATVTLSNQTGFGDIRYTTDGSLPLADSPLYSAPVEVKLPTRVTANVFHDGRALAAPVSEDIDTMSLLYRDNHDLVPCTKNILLSLEDDAPLDGPRARYLVDIGNPCWMWKNVDLSNVAAIEAGVGQLPFNFQIGADKDKIALLPPKTPDGELEIHRDSCTGELIGDLPLAPAVGNDAVTKLGGALTAPQGVHDLCFTFTRKSVDPIWAVDWVQLVPRKEP